MRLNPIEKEITMTRLRTFKENTIVALMFDMDIKDGTGILEKNIKILKSSKNIKDIVLIAQIKSFEEELMRASNIKNIKDFTKNKSNSGFKRDFLSNRNLENLFTQNKFDISKFWIGTLTGLYKNINNELYKILIKNK